MLASLDWMDSEYILLDSAFPIIEFSVVNGTSFLHYEFRAIKIDKSHGKEQLAKHRLTDKCLQGNALRQ